jgi:vacuolar-type H+-ATPase subunit E/Vma4
VIGFESIVDVQLRAMLEGIEQDLTQRREAVLAEARHRARALLRDARRQARVRMAQAVAEERNQWDSSLQRAGASLAARVRRKQQVLDRGQLELGQQRLREVLAERWRDGRARAEWAALLLAEAEALLPNSRWRIEYPVAMDAGEAAMLLQSADSAASVELEPSDQFDVGFRLSCAEARLDMSATGLLAQAEEIAGELLAEIHRQQQRLGASS